MRSRPLTVFLLVLAGGSACRQPAAPPAASPTVEATACPAQMCRSDHGACDAIVIDAFQWDGTQCVEVQDSGCGTVGPDCAALYETLEACRRAHAHC
jgi:hypothetical protein